MEAFEVDNRTEFPPLLHRAERPTPIVASDDDRPRQDVHWLYAHGALMAFCLIGGIVTIICVPGIAWQQSSRPESVPPGACPMHHPYGRRSLLQTSDDMYSKHPRAWHYWVLLLFLIVGSLGIGWVFVLGFKHRAMLMVQTAIGVTVLIPFLSFFVNISQGHWVAGVIWGVITGLLMWTVHAWKQQIDLVGRLLGIAGHVLVETPTLIGMSVALQLAQGLLITLPAGYFALCAGLNGNLKPNPNRASDDYVQVIKAQKVYVCKDEYGQAVHCCSWETNTWGQVYLIFLVLFVIWNTLLAGQIKLFTVAGAVAQWYFAAAPNVEYGTVASTSTTPVKLPSGRVTRSLRHALGPSLGSLCLGAIVLGIVNALRSVSVEYGLCMLG